MRKWIPSSVLALVAFAAIAGCDTTEKNALPGLVIYSSVDDEFARPVCETFQKQTGIVVRLISDTEDRKSTGVLNRLIAERKRPVADVFWSGDPARAAILKREGISAAYRPADPADKLGRYSDPEGHWSALSARARVIIYNTHLVSPGDEPKSLNDFLNPKWKGKACIANPLFGTTTMHAAALVSLMGEANAEEFFKDLRNNRVVMLKSNGDVMHRVAAGEFAFGLTDTDDFNVAKTEGDPVNMTFPDQQGVGTLVVPNAVVLIAKSPNNENGKRFIDFVLTAATERALAMSNAAQMPLRPEVPAPDHVKRVDEIKSMAVNYEELADEMDHFAQGFLRNWAAQ